jgi:hypothetical protein
LPDVLPVVHAQPSSWRTTQTGVATGVPSRRKVVNDTYFARSKALDPASLTAGVCSSGGPSATDRHLERRPTTRTLT